MSKHGAGVDHGSTHVEIHVCVDGAGFVLELGLDLSVLGPGLGGEGAVEGQLQALADLVLDVDLSREVVVGVPLLSEGQTVLLEPKIKPKSYQ